jgi:hypothetical protein
MQWIMSVLIGVALSATCGFRIFIPLLGIGIACRAGHLNIDPDFQWIASYPALAAFAVASVLEVGTYYIPWLDNLMDTIATPAAVVAGTIATASVVTDMSPLLRWSLAIVAGGGAAAAVQSASVVARGASTAVTGGIGNPIISTFELAASIIGTILAIVLPVIAIAFLITVILFLSRKKIMSLFSSKEPAGIHSVPPHPERSS